VEESASEFKKSYPHTSEIEIKQGMFCKLSTKCGPVLDILVPKLYIPPDIDAVTLFTELTLTETENSNQDFGVCFGQNNIVFHCGARVGGFCDAIRVEGPGGFSNVAFGGWTPAFNVWHQLKIVARQSGEWTVKLIDGRSRWNTFQAKWHNSQLFKSDHSIGPIGIKRYCSSGIALYRKFEVVLGDSDSDFSWDLHIDAGPTTKSVS